jgi:dermatan 4-sulfotransferase 1
MIIHRTIQKFISFFDIKLTQEAGRLPPFYQIYPPPLTIELLDILGLVNHKYQFVYFRIFKAANSTIVASLYNAETLQAITSLSELQKIKDHYYERPSTLSLDQVNKIQKDYFKFTFVRNPYTRVLAAYLDKIVSNEAGKRDMVAKFLNKPANSEISFNDFLDYLENGGIDHNAHWARQMDLLSIPIAELNFIGKTENLTEHLNYVLSIIFETNQTIVSVCEHATSATRSIRELDKVTKARICKLYEVDFEHFDYLK